MRVPSRLTLAIATAFAMAACTGTGSESSLPIDTSTSPATTASTQPTETVPEATTTTTVQVAAAELSDLDGLGFDDFLEESYEFLLLRNPEFLTSLGLSDEYGLRDDRLNNLSPEYLEETQALEVGILDRLRTYERSALSAEHAVSFDVYQWYLDQRVRGHRFAYHDYPVHDFVNSYNFHLILLLTEEHAIETVEDAEDYLSRLSKIDEQVAQLLDRLRISEAMGVFPPEIIATRAKATLRGDLGGTDEPSAVRVGRLPLYTSFVDRLKGVNGLDEPTRVSLLNRAIAELEESFVPAWVALIDHLEQIEPSASPDAGVWRLPDGVAYYGWLLREHTSTDLTAEEIHRLGLEQVARVEAELRAAFDDLGYSKDAAIGELRRRAAEEAGFLDGSGGGVEAVVSAYEDLIIRAEESLQQSFNLWPQADIGIVPEPWNGGGYYVPSSVDGSRPGSFHAGAGSNVAVYIMPTVTYHEAVPGHHTQIAIARELGLPTFRRFVEYNAFIEGWALYAERLASEIGLYEDDPYGNIGRLELELLRAVRLVVDTGIHAMRWSDQTAHDYMSETISEWSHEVERYMVYPGQATGYMIGMQTILDLRDQTAAAGTLDIAAFHDTILGGGSMPLSVLRATVEESLNGD
ncbi:MAG: hypothetical protein DRJ28_04595 [Actinobacteria bacterium]|nr:MAG: hypothetical protein DRJ28_04595 [Actinomycetota bacterium]